MPLYKDNMNAEPRVRDVPALSRGIAILRLLSATDRPLGVHAIARALGLVPSTALHILRVLAAERLIAFDPATKKYAIAAGLAALARTALRCNTFVSLVQPELDELSRVHRATAVAVEASGLEHMVVTALARADSPLRVHVDIGSSFPALISATGRCIAAFGAHPWSAIRERFRLLRWDDPPSWTAWRAEVARTRADGYAVDDGRYIRGVTIVAAPVRMTSDPVNALVVIGIRDQMLRCGLATIGADLRLRAARLGAALGSRS